MAENKGTERRRKVLGRTIKLTSDANSVVAIPASLRRVALQIGNNSGAAWFLNLTDKAPAAGAGVPIATGASAILLTAQDLGDAVAMQMSLIINAAATDVFLNEWVEGA